MDDVHFDTYPTFLRPDVKDVKATRRPFGTHGTGMGNVGNLFELVAGIAWKMMSFRI